MKDEKNPFKNEMLVRSFVINGLPYEGKGFRENLLYAYNKFYKGVPPFKGAVKLEICMHKAYGSNVRRKDLERGDFFRPPSPFLNNMISYIAKYLSGYAFKNGGQIAEIEAKKVWDRYRSYTTVKIWAIGDED